MSLPIPDNEPQRLAALHALDILDTVPDIAYDEIAELAAQICGCPVGYISFIDDDRRWLKAKYGLPPEISRGAARNGGVRDDDLRHRRADSAGHDAGPAF